MAHLLHLGIALQELERIKDQLQKATDRNTKKQLEHELSITQVKRNIAEAYRVR